VYEISSLCGLYGIKIQSCITLRPAQKGTAK